MEVKSMADAVAEVEYLNLDLREVLSALQVLDDAMEEDSCPVDKRDARQAFCFMERFPMYFDTYRVLCRALKRIHAELQEIVDKMYKESREVSPAIIKEHRNNKEEQ